MDLSFFALCCIDWSCLLVHSSAPRQSTQFWGAPMYFHYNVELWGSLDILHKMMRSMAASDCVKRGNGKARLFTSFLNYAHDFFLSALTLNVWVLAADVAIEDNAFVHVRPFALRTFRQLVALGSCQVWSCLASTSRIKYLRTICELQAV